MDFQKFVDNYRAMTCIISVERKSDGSCGTIRIVAANAAYIASIEDQMHTASSQMLKNRFIPDSEYTDYIPKDLNFEDLCYRAAILGQPQHSYIHPERYPFWLKIIAMPLVSDDPNIGYCSYTQEINETADTKQLANHSAETLASVVKTCIKLHGKGDIYSNFKDVVEEIREICDSNHCCVLLIDHKTKSCHVLAEAIREGSGLLPMDTYLDGAFYDIACSWKDTIAGSNCIIVKDANDMEVLKKRNPVWHDSLAGAGAKSIVLFPLKYSGTTLGYIWAINFDTANTVKIKETLGLSTFFMASEISNHLLVEQLKIMSSIDELTGIKNRNAMNSYIDNEVQNLWNKEAMGIVYIDINGLKYINDNEGHNAGDMLIKNAAVFLNKVCHECEFFRAGGDEFIIIARNISEAKFDELIRRLKINCYENDGTDFAVGGCHSYQEADMREAMHIADEKMYFDKENYYVKFPERRR